MQGKFVSNIKKEYIDLLNDIKEKCTNKSLFIYDQTNRIAKMIKDKYNDNLNFEWKKFPSYATFKNPKNKKWYGIIMNIDKSKLDKNKNGEVEIINVKLQPEKIEKLLTKAGFYESYHMNKKIGYPLF